VAMEERMAAKSWAPPRERRLPETLTRSFGILIVCSAPLFVLCRYRHNTNYADIRVMPMSVRSSLVTGHAGSGRSA
jgi:hypothetical protein